MTASTSPVIITPLERKILVEGVIENPHYTESGWAWTNTVADYAKVDPKAARGAISSLKTKGLIQADGNVGEDACVRPTEAGLAMGKEA